MRAEGLVHADSGYPVSFTLIIAFLLLAPGLATIFSMVFHAGPFEA
jgi:putative membrane protein